MAKKPTTPKPKTTKPAPAKSELTPSACPKCGCTEHTGYHGIRRMATGGTTASGHVYNLIVWRRTSCKSCGQHRVDRSYEMVEVPKPKRVAADVSPPSPPKSAPKKPSRGKSATQLSGFRKTRGS